MENNNTSWDFSEKVADKANEFVHKYYKETYVDKFLSLEIVQSTFKNDIFISVNLWFEKNIKIITQIIWWISLICWIILILSPLQMLLLFLGLFAPGMFIFTLLSVVMWFIVAIITFINGIWLIKMKKWLPFMTIVYFFVANWLNIITNLFFPNLWYFTNYGWAMFSMIIWLVISISISFLCTCLIVKNKDKFNN